MINYKFEITQRTDDVKNEYALKNNIPLLRISYRETEQESIQKNYRIYKIIIFNDYPIGCEIQQ